MLRRKRKIKKKGNEKKTIYLCLINSKIEDDDIKYTIEYEPSKEHITALL